MFSFFFCFYFILFERQNYSKTEKHREILHLLDYSLIGYIGWGWARPKQGTRNFALFSPIEIGA